MRVRALAFVSVASLALLAGCGDDGGDDSPEAQAFCGVVDPIQAVPSVLENYEDIEAVRATMTQAEAALGQVSGAPPEGIAEDIDTVNSLFGPANEALKAVDYDFNALTDEDAEAVDTALRDPEYTTAADNIQDWSTDNCD